MPRFEFKDIDAHDIGYSIGYQIRMEISCGVIIAKCHGVGLLEEVAGHVRKVLKVVGPDRVVIHPD